MALSLQKKLELAGALSKVEPQLQRLHLLPPPKTHRLRNAILIGSALVFVGAVAVAGVVRRRGGGDDPLVEIDEEVLVVPEEGLPETSESADPDSSPDLIA